MIGTAIWIGIGLAVVAWLIGLLLEIGPIVHLALVVAALLLAVQIRRSRGPTGR